MRMLLVGLFLLHSFSALAQTRAVQVFAPDEFVPGHVTAFLDSGEVIHVPVEKIETVDQLKRSLHLGETMSFEVGTVTDEAPVINEIESQPAQRAAEDKEMFDPARHRSIQWTGIDPLEKANLSSVATYEAAQAVMNGMNGDTDDDSQCYNRAHMWSYEALVNQRVNLGKIWIFFTRKYIREFRYKWWFHVSPYTEVGTERFRYVLDRGFTMIPYTVENWKNLFIQNQANCPVVTDYRQYEGRPEEAYCYLIYSSQYYWQPWQLKKVATEGQHFYGYKNSELEIAYKDALGTRRVSIPVLRNPIPNPDIGPNPNPNPNPRPEPRPIPQPDPDYSGTLRNGDSVVLQNYLHRAARVINLVGNELYDIQFQDGRREVLRSVSRKYIAAMSGCVSNICVGHRVLNTGLVQEIVYNKVLAVTHDGLFVVQFEEGRNTNSRSWGWHESYLAQTSACHRNGNGWCVGDRAFSRVLNAEVRVIGHQDQGLVLEITSGRERGWRVKHYRDQLSRL